MEINVGAVILSSGLEPFDPKVREEYHYGEFRERGHQHGLRAAAVLHRALRKVRSCVPPT